MNIQELKEFFEKSDYSDETKTVLTGILADKTEVTPGLVSQLKDVLQKELDADFEEIDSEMKNDPEMKKIEQEYVETLDKIEKDLNEDMSFVEKELNDLEEIRKQITKVGDEIEADKIKQSIGSSM
jgi:small-conductance mechanosensitive channel